MGAASPLFGHDENDQTTQGVWTKLRPKIGVSTPKQCLKIHDRRGIPQPHNVASTPYRATLHLRPYPQDKTLYNKQLDPLLSVMLTITPRCSWFLIAVQESPLQF